MGLLVNIYRDKYDATNGGLSRFGRKIEEILGHKFYGALPIHDRFE